MSTIDRGFIIHGRVQGVGFRWWTRETAGRMGVVGSVKNLRDGTVEVMARGEEDVVDRFADKLRKGPRSARVERVVEVEADLAEHAASFTIERA